MEYLTEQGNMWVRSFHLVELNIEEDIPLRNNELHVDGHGFNRLLDVVEKGQHIASSNLITNLMPNVNSLRDTYDTFAKIDGGWRQKRAIFMLEVVSDYKGVNIVSYVSGYTNYVDQTFSGIHDPGMRLYINNVITTKEYNGNTSFMHAFQVIGGKLEEDFELTRLMRPVDVLSHLSAKTFASGERGLEIDYTVNDLSKNTLASNGDNNNGVEVVRKVLNGVIETTQRYDFNEQDALINSTNSIAEENLVASPFLDALMRYEYSTSVSSFTLETLEAVVGDFTINPVVTGDPLVDSVMHADSTVDTTAIMKEVTIAIDAMNGMLGLLSKSMLTSLTFTVNNTLSHTRQPTINVLSFVTMIHGVDVSPLVDRVIDNFLGMHFPVLTQNNLFGLDMLINIDLLGFSSCTISIDGGRQETVSLPTCASSTFNPNIFTDNQYQNEVAAYGEMVRMI